MMVVVDDESDLQMDERSGWVRVVTREREERVEF
jgi:hypothetical protein